VLDQINRGARVISISGLVAGPARALVLAALQRQTAKHFALVVRRRETWKIGSAISAFGTARSAAPLNAGMPLPYCLLPRATLMPADRRTRKRSSAAPLHYGGWVDANKIFCCSLPARSPQNRSSVRHYESGRGTPSR